MINYLKLLKKIYQSKIFYILLTLFTFLSFYLIANSLKKESIYNPKQTFFTGEIIKIKKTDYGYSLILKNRENLKLMKNYVLYYEQTSPLDVPLYAFGQAKSSLKP